MSKPSRRRLLLLTIPVVLVAGLVWWRYGTRSVPDGQPPLVTLDSASLATLREDFNRRADHVRIIVLLAPT